MITVTLQQIKDANPCTDGWKKVLGANGGLGADMNAPFALSTILDSNGLDDTLWVISNVPELSKYDGIWRKFASWCALQVVDKIKKYCSDADYGLIIEWLETNNPEIMVAAESAAWSAAESAAWSAAEFAAESAAESAARSAARSAWSAAWSAEFAAWSAEFAAESAAESAARSAARSARSAESAESAAQKQKLRELLACHEEKM